jgi:heme-degrading monooxygenase HmoA
MRSPALKKSEEGTEAELLGEDRARSLASAGLARFARLTTMYLQPGPDGSFERQAEALDEAFKKTLAVASLKNGFVDCQRVLNAASGECRICSYWETEADAEKSFSDDDYYSGGKNVLRPFVRFDQFKTEHFVSPERLKSACCRPPPNTDMASMANYVCLQEVRPFFPEGSLLTSTFARFGTVQLIGQDDTVKHADAFYTKLVRNTLRMQNGFVGAQRLLGTGDAAGTFILITYWSTLYTLQRSSPPPDFTYVPSECVAPGMDMELGEFTSFTYQKPDVVQVPWLEPGSTSAATFQLACISLGVGIFVMPSVFASFGLMLGSSLVITFAVLSVRGSDYR